MARNRTDQEFRQKLDSREILPSAQAWDRLDAMLSVSESRAQKPIRRIGWIYYAAASVAVLLAAFFLTRGGSEAPANRVVEAPSIISAPKKEGLSNPEYKVVPPSRISVGTKLSPKNREAVAVATPSVSTSASPNKASANTIELSSPAEPKSQYSLDTAPQLQQELGVDALLAATKADVPPTEHKVKVDAGSLLSQVDGELELTFREKVIRTVGKNYKNVKVALANRNQE